MKHSYKKDDFIIKKLNWLTEGISNKNHQSKDNSKFNIEKQFNKFLNERREKINCQTSSDWTWSTWIKLNNILKIDKQIHEKYDNNVIDYNQIESKLPEYYTDDKNVQINKRNSKHHSPSNSWNLWECNHCASLKEFDKDCVSPINSIPESKNTFIIPSESKVKDKMK